MATTYTTNYHLGKQTDHGDKFDMSVITDNMDIIDAQMKTNNRIGDYCIPQTVEHLITSSDISLFHSGIMYGQFSTDATGLTTSRYGILRAYNYRPDVTDVLYIIQVLELPDIGTILMRRKDYSWSAWYQATEYKSYSHDTITSASLVNFKEGVIGGVLSTDITGGANDIDGIVRAYHTTSLLESIQIAEAVDGTRKTRYWLTGTTWSAWV